eukprot:11071152-Ditylum_brightwellii.AAC.1
MRAWQEATTASPLGQHLGHFKVPVHRHSMSLDTDEGQELSAKQDDLVNAHTDLLSSSEKRGTLNRGLHGGRHGHNAQTLSLIEELNLVARKKGLHKNAIFMHAQMLEQAKYRLKTVLGVIKEYYQHCTTFPIYGSGQGATNSLGIWLTISVIIGDTYEQSANGAEFISPDKAITLVLAISGFVDDITNLVNKFTDNHATTLQLLLKTREDGKL